MKNLLLALALLLMAAGMAHAQCSPPPVYYGGCPPPTYYYYPQTYYYTPAYYNYPTYCGPTYTVPQDKVYRVPAYTPSYQQQSKKEQPPQRVPYFERDYQKPAPKLTSTTIRTETAVPKASPKLRVVERLEPVPDAPVRPKVEFSEEIKSTFYVQGILPDGSKYRVPIINGLAPNVWIGRHNGKIDTVRFLFEKPAAEKYAGKEGDTLNYKTGPTVPSIQESVEKDGVEEIHHQFLNSLYVPGRVTAKVEPTPPAPKKAPKPDDSLRPPSQIDKK